MRSAVWPARCKYNECVCVHHLDEYIPWSIYINFSSTIPSRSVFTPKNPFRASRVVWSTESGGLEYRSGGLEYRNGGLEYFHGGLEYRKWWSGVQKLWS